MKELFSPPTSRLDAGVRAITPGHKLFLESRASQPGFFLPIEDSPAREQNSEDHMEQEQNESREVDTVERTEQEPQSYGGSQSPLVQITLISCAEDLKKLSTD